MGGHSQEDNPRTLQDYPSSYSPAQAFISLIFILIVLWPLLNSPNPVAFPGSLSWDLWALSQKLAKRHQPYRRL